MKIVVGLSGGVDSSVAAKLLVDQGHEVIGVFMKNWEDGGEDCTATQDAADAERVAKALNIPFHTVNFAKNYWDQVFEHFLAELRAGRTPNPDILCNKYVKFGPFLDYAAELGAAKIATGHYARIKKHAQALEPGSADPGSESGTSLFQLCLPKDSNKDQTYFLHQLNQAQLSKTLFPLADYTKPEIRQMAGAAGLITAGKKDSTGICFVGPKNYRQFVTKYLAKTPGNILDLTTRKKVGDHIGLSFYTIGQSEGVGIGGQRDFPEGKWYVVAKESETNNLLVSQNEEDLATQTLITEPIHWITGENPRKIFRTSVKIRYRDVGVPAEVLLLEDGGVEVRFDDPVRAVTPGQSAVFYQEDVCLGGGVIEK